jgi:hypothetical protein
MVCYVLRIELWCGSDQRGSAGLRAAEHRYQKAQKVADRFNIETYFDEHYENGTNFRDGYLYPHSCNVEAVLDALDKEGVEYDNIDLPEELDGSALSKRLHKRFPLTEGVSVNDGGMDDPEPHGQCSLPIARRPDVRDVRVREHRRRA